MSWGGLLRALKGGAGSGNFGHGGRPGKVGGSTVASTIPTELYSNPNFKQNPNFNPPNGYELVLHTSRNENIKSIAQHGLMLGAKARHSAGWSPDPDHIWFWRDMQDKYAKWTPKKESAVIIAVPTSKINNLPDTRAAYYQKGESIPPEWIAGVISNINMYK